MTTTRGWLIIAGLLAGLFALVLVYGPHESGPERPLEAAVTAEPGPPAQIDRPTGPGPYRAAQTAVRAPLPPTTAPLDAYAGRYACRFATAGRVTPCCPDATETLAQFWTGPDLAVADYVIGRESGCDASIVNGSGCVGWFQLCGWSCPGSCRDGYANAATAHDLWARYGWCSTASWYLQGDPVTGGHCDT